MIVCFEGSRHIMWRLFGCLEKKNEAKKNQIHAVPVQKSTCYSKGGVCLSGGPCPGPWWPGKKYPMEYLVQRERI